jgi:hypothetical protein
MSTVIAEGRPRHVRDAVLVAFGVVTGVAVMMARTDGEPTDKANNYYLVGVQCGDGARSVESSIDGPTTTVHCVGNNSFTEIPLRGLSEVKKPEDYPESAAQIREDEAKTYDALLHVAKTTDRQPGLDHVLALDCGGMIGTVTVRTMIDIPRGPHENSDALNRLYYSSNTSTSSPGIALNN